MQYEEAFWYSDRLRRNMGVKIYGHYGFPVLAYPCQNKGNDDFYLNGMIDALAPLIESGRMKLYCVATNDDVSVCDESWDHGKAAYELDQYHHYIVQEVLPFIYQKQGGFCLPLLVGASMGGCHAANHFFRRPDLFAGFIVMSCSFEMSRFFDGYMDENVYNNSPVHYLQNMPSDHPYIDIYNQRAMHAVIGAGAFEYLADYTYRWLQGITDEKGIHVNYHYWDENISHDWPSWRYELPYFLNEVLP